ncbi:MAG: alkyl sulfatase dimerization domain-containing protein, partial [Pedobacter sp.]|nr:alkyl sulfatase dimerization domain-containing protein [Pedobacter sp.]
MDTVFKKSLLAITLTMAGNLALAADAPKEATSTTIKTNDALKQELPFSNRQDYEDAQRGFIATLPDIDIKGEKGNTIWTLKGYEFLKQDQAAASVNPSLWRNAQLNMYNGLFKVVDGIYQIRGFDLSNMTIVEGKTGIIIIDPLISSEMAKAGLDLYYKNRPKKPVKAVIYTHSHIDHYGGVKGVISEADAKSGKVKVLAPEGFLEEAVSENVFAGNAMARRAIYMYGALLPRSDKGQIDGGLGKTTSVGTVTLIAPNDLIKKTGEKRVIDGVEIVFQMAPGTEAPAEMLFYFPQFKAISAAEDATHTLHNLYTLRGAQVRDANKWWKALNETLAMWGDKTDVVFASHHWPTWGQDNVQKFVGKQRDAYKYLHDQSLRLINMGYTMTEVGELIKLPPELGNEWYNRGYYGSVNHDAKAVYQRYMGWYSGNPSDLNPLPPEESAKRYVDFMGGADAAIKKSKEAFDKGDYRWVSEVMSKVVFADPKNQTARNLLADSLEQQGYQAESGPWRNVFLMGAYELRNGVPKVEGTVTASPDTIKAMTPDMVLDYMAMRVNPEKVAGKKIAINWKLDAKTKYLVTVNDSVLLYQEGKSDPKADVTITLSKESLGNIVLGATTYDKEVEAG